MPTSTPTLLARLVTGAAVLAAALPGAALAADAAPAAVCNEAENSHRGGYSVSGGPVDPNPPAFLRGSQMRVGKDPSAGLVHAAERSPALRTCGPESVELPPVDGGGGGELPPTDGGGDGGGGIIIS